MKDESSLPEAYEQHVFSIISTEYLVRAVDLWQMMIWDMSSEAVASPAGGARVAPLESSYAASICLLSLIGFDGALARCKVIRKDEIACERSWKDLVSKFAPNISIPHLEAVGELEILRDALAHNHVWRVHYRLGDDGSDKFLKAEIQTGFGDKKFKERVDENSLATRGPLKLRVIPTHLTRQDALIVFGAIWVVLQELAEALGQGAVATRVLQVRSRPTRDSARQFVSFEDWLTEQVDSHERAKQALRSISTQ